MLVLIAEYDDGSYEPVCEVLSLSEADEIARDDFDSRDPNSDPCPDRYVVRHWGRTPDTWTATPGEWSWQ